jgi:GMP synthase (glutamine-hydrolysing)
MKKAVVFRHMYSASLFSLEDILQKNGFEYHYIDTFHDSLADFDANQPDLLVVLGGGMGVYQQDIFPYLGDEIKIMRDRLDAGKPMLGICLGAQLMAAALGEKVYKGEQGREFGWFDLQITEDGKNSPIAAFAPEKTRILQLHGDTFDLPQGAKRLASSVLYENQAFSYGKTALAVQFHPEYNLRAVENMLVEHSGVDVEKIRRESRDHVPGMMAAMDTCMDMFFKEAGLKDA